MERITFEMYDRTVGIENPHEKPEVIIGGEDVPDTVDLSYFVPFVYDPNNSVDTFKCGGTAISADMVLAAEHCFETTDNIPGLWARIRGWDLREPAPLSSQIKKVVVPANPVGDGDIALVTLNYSGLVPLSIISPDDIIIDEEIQVYGHGDIDLRNTVGTISPLPKMATLYQQDNIHCGGYAGAGEVCLYDRVLEINNVGRGDSSGPAVQNVKNVAGYEQRVLRGVIVETDPEISQYSIITDLTDPAMQEFIKECTVFPETKPELCEIRYDRYPHEIETPPSSTLFGNTTHSPRLSSGVPEMMLSSNDELVNDYVPLGLLLLTIAAFSKYMRPRKR